MIIHDFCIESIVFIIHNFSLNIKNIYSSIMIERIFSFCTSKGMGLLVEEKDFANHSY